MLAACTPSTPKEYDVENADPLRVVSLTLKSDSVQGSLENVTRELQEVKAQLDSLRDSIANVPLKNPMGDRVMYGGIPKGDPIKVTDGANGRRLAPRKKPQPTQGTGKTPGKGSDPSQRENTAKTEEARLINIERMRIHDSIEKAKDNPLNGGK
jgi:hypothetical protein